MYGSKEYAFAVALLNFSRAWEQLVNASQAVPELDVSELYPFYLLDYEEIQPAVKQWCDHTASKIMKEVPDRIPNPACATCKHLYDGLGPDGMCKGYEEMQCGRYPLIAYDRDTVRAFCIAQGNVVDGFSDNTLQGLYTLEVRKKYEEAVKQ